MCTGRALSATTRVLGIPEVVDFICSSSCLSRSDIASLCQVSRYMSGISTPLLWRHVTAEGLLRLIYSSKLSWRKNGALRSIILDEHSTDDKTFARFHSYAPYIRTLDIYDGRYRRCYTMEGWGILRDELKVQGRPLLPNLKTLRFLNTSPSHGLDELKWISIFATHGVNEVFIAPKRLSSSGQIPFSVGSTILKTLVDLCPGVQKLDLSTNDTPYPSFLGNSRFHMALAHQPARPWHQELEHLTRLRHLTVSKGWLYPASFLALGRLPELEFLSITPGIFHEFDDVYIFNIKPALPSGAFPQLTKLSILGFDGFDIGGLLSIAEMSRKITAVKLELCLDAVQVNDQPYELDKIFEGLSNASCLRELHLDFPFQSEEGERPVKIYDATEEMGLHPSLEYVHISGIRIRRGRGYIRNLASIWPNVRTLSMPSQPTSIRELEEFATLPSLRYLTVNLNLKYPSLPTEPAFERTPLKTLASSGPVRLSKVYKDLSLGARALLLLWPSLERVTWSDIDPGRMRIAHIFNSIYLRFSRELPFVTPREDEQLATIKPTEAMIELFKWMEDWEEADSESDTSTDDDEGSSLE